MGQKMPRRRYTLIGASAIALGLASPVYAQTAPDSADDTTAADIMVTAQKRSENLQRVPIAVGVVSGENLNALSVRDIGDLNGIAPGLSVAGNAGAGGNNPLAIRGISGQVTFIGAEQAVAIYLDGVYLPRPDAAFFSLNDVERIEVLRGPQGTLFGRNATAGAVNIVTRRPGHALTGTAEVGYGSFNEYFARGNIELPMTKELSFGVSASLSGRDGYFINAVTGNRVGGREDFSGRVKAFYEAPSGAFDLLLSADHAVLNSADFFQNLVSPQNGAVIGLGDRGVIESVFENSTDTRRVIEGISATANIELASDLTLTSISAYRRFSGDAVYDVTGVNIAPYRRNTTQLRNSTHSQEVRLDYVTDALRILAGVNYYKDDGRFSFVAQTAATPAAALALPSIVDPRPQVFSVSEAYAGFGQIEWSLNDRVKFTAGARYNSETRDLLATTPARPGQSSYGKVKADAFIPKVTLSFQIDPDMMLYSAYSRGFQAGGINSSVTVPNAVDTFNPENLDSYEVGLRSQLFDRTLRLNVTAFHVNYRDLQVRTTLGPGLIDVNNAASATIDGIELDAGIRAGRGVNFTVFANYVNARYGRFTELVNGVPFIRDGNRLNRAPQLQGGVRLDIDRPISSDIRLKATANLSLESKSFFTPENSVLASNDGWAMADLRLGLAFRERFELSAFVKNLTDNRYTTYVIATSATQINTSVADPRRFGLSARVNF